MNRVQTSPSPWYRRTARAVIVATLALSSLWLAPSMAFAAKKKEEPAPTKSYVLPYMIVMLMVGVGLMTVCRPGKRLERADGKKWEEP